MRESLFSLLSLSLRSTGALPRSPAQGSSAAETQDSTSDFKQLLHGGEEGEGGGFSSYLKGVTGLGRHPSPSSSSGEPAGVRPPQHGGWFSSLSPGGSDVSCCPERESCVSLCSSSNPVGACQRHHQHSSQLHSRRLPVLTLLVLQEHSGVQTCPFAFCD